jgi:hypothetical protein
MPADNDAVDFRSHAVAASEALRRNLPSGLSPEKSGFSYCLERRPSLSRLRTPLKFTAVASLIVGISGVAGGGVIGLLFIKHIIADSPMLLVVALCCSVGGILSMLLPTIVEGRVAYRHLSQRNEKFGLGSPVEGLHVDVENAITYDTMKAVADDVGLIYVYPDSQYVKIAGLSYEYVILRKDVAGLSLHSNGKDVLLSYTVGEERLNLVIVPRSLWAELKRQTLGTSRSFFANIQDALELPD